MLEDPGSYGYFREETGGLMVGLFEGVAAPWKVEGIPEDSSFTTIPPDWDRMGPFLEKAMARVPASFDVGVRTFFCGPESFTPDLSPVVGEAPEVRGYFVAAGLNSIGILTGGGIGRVVAHWVMNGRPDVDVTGDGRRPAARLPDHPRVPPGPHRRVARARLRVPLPGPLADDRARREALAVCTTGWRPPARTSAT